MAHSSSYRFNVQQNYAVPSTKHRIGLLSPFLRMWTKSVWQNWRSGDRASWEILIRKLTRCINFSNLFFGIKLYMFRTVPLSIIRSSSLYTQQWYMPYRFANSLRAGSGRNQFRPDPARCAQCVYNEELLTPKYVQFYSKNKFEKLVHLFGFNIRMSLTLCPLI